MSESPRNHTSRENPGSVFNTNGKVTAEINQKDNFLKENKRSFQELKALKCFGEGGREQFSRPRDLVTLTTKLRSWIIKKHGRKQQYVKLEMLPLDPN